MISFHNFQRPWQQALRTNPEQVINGNISGHSYLVTILIPDYQQRVRTYYADVLNSDLDKECQMLGIPQCPDHFGILIRFSNPTEISLYDQNGVIYDGLCELISEFGTVIFHNVFFESAIRSYGHRNRFPHLRFHVDRNKGQEARYSMYARDPFDAEQKHPRTSSTLFIPNIVAHLQGVKEGSVDQATADGVTSSSVLFEKQAMDQLLGNIILEQRWDEPTGTGEISIIDNATVLHASYYRDAQRSGYKIGVRYLAGTKEISL